MVQKAFGESPKAFPRVPRGLGEGPGRTQTRRLDFGHPARPFRRLGKDLGARRSQFLRQQALNNGIHGRRTLPPCVHPTVQPRAHGPWIHINAVDQDGG